MRPALLFCLLLALSAARALPLQPVPVPGGVAVVALDPSPQRPQARFGKRRVMVLRDGEGWVAVVGLSLDLSPGIHTLRVTGPDYQARFPITVRPKAYAEQHLTIRNKRKVNPLKRDLKRIEQDFRRIRAAKRHWR